MAAHSKKIIKETLKKIIKGQTFSEGPLDSIRGAVAGAKGFAGGLKRAGQTAAGNFRVGQVKSQMDQFVDKVEKTWDLHKRKAEKPVNKLKNSKNPDVSATGGQIEKELEDTDTRVKQVSQDVKQSFPSAVGRSMSSFEKKRGRDDEEGGGAKRFIKWVENKSGAKFVDLSPIVQKRLLDMWEKKVASEEAAAEKAAEEFAFSPAKSEPSVSSSEKEPKLKEPEEAELKPEPKEPEESNLEPELKEPEEAKLEPELKKPLPPPAPSRFPTKATKDIRSPIGALVDLGITKDYFGDVTNQLNKNNPNAKALVLSMKFGDEEEAKKNWEKLKNDIDMAKKDSNPTKALNIEPSLEKSIDKGIKKTFMPRKGKKKRVAMPPQKKREEYTTKRLREPEKPAPPPPLPPQMKPTKVVKPPSARPPKKESVTMESVMRALNNPEQIKMAREKLKEAKKSRKSKK